MKVLNFTLNPNIEEAMLQQRKEEGSLKDYSVF